jgi:hypothetical protein
MVNSRVNPRRLTKGVSLTALALVACMGILGTASALAKPTGDFAVFSDCAVKTAGLTDCIYAETTSGEVAIGTTKVPIKNKITLQGGYSENEATEIQTFIGATDGNTLSKTAQPVPGGLTGLVNCQEIKGSGFFEKVERASCEAIFENGLTGVNAVTELATPANTIGISTNNLINGEGIALSLPARVKLENPLLGSECYIGSSSSPVTLALTTGTTSPPPPNKPITGKIGKVAFKDEFEYLIITGNSLVNNSFSAPAASGCGGIFSFLIDPIIDSKLGLPSAAGHNTAILTGSLQRGTREGVLNSEK